MLGLGLPGGLGRRKEVGRSYVVGVNSRVPSPWSSQYSSCSLWLLQPVPKTLSRNVVPVESVSAPHDIITGAISGVQTSRTWIPCVCRVRR
jgi:hypothetical protein